MNSSKSSQKHTDKIFSETIEPYELFHHLSYMAATAASGIPGRKVFDLASQVAAKPAPLFDAIHKLVDNLRFTFPTACSMVGERLHMGDMRTFLLRLADAMRSGEPLAPFLEREAQVQGERYANDYESALESLKKWNDGYTSVTISVALIVVINMVSTMIYDLGVAVMAMMAFGSIIIGFVISWILSRAAPQEVMTVPWSKGSAEQRRAVKLLKILGPLALLVPLIVGVLGADTGWVFVAGGIFLLPVGIVAGKAESETAKKDAEVSAFFRSLGGTATSQGTTLGRALQSMELNSFPTLRPHVQTLSLRLKAGAKPETCWRMFGTETGSMLINQAANMFFDATNLGGDAEQSGMLCSLFTNRISMLRARRRGVAGTFGWLTLTMHTVITALLFFILEILRKFIELMQSAANLDVADEAVREMAASMMSFSTPQTAFLEQLALALIVLMALTNAFAIVASEGSSMVKMSYYLSVMLFITGFGIQIIPSLVGMVL